jgi:hypothetical protein
MSDRSVGLSWWLVAASVVTVLLVLTGGVLYLKAPAFRRRVDYIPVRAHMWVLERQRQRSMPTIPPPVSHVPEREVLATRSWPTAQPFVGPTPTERREPSILVPSFAASPLGPPATGTPVVLSTPSPTSTSTPSATPSSTPTPTRVRATIEVTRVRHVWQAYNNCGPATLSMVLSYYGRSETQSDVQKAVRPNRWDMNASPWELVSYARSLDLEGMVRAGGEASLIKQLLDAGIPVMLEVWYYPDEHGGGHYRMIVGYDEGAQEWIAYDVQLGPGYRIAYEQQNQEWQAFNRTYLIIYRADQANLVNSVMGDELDDRFMYGRALEVALSEQKAAPQNAFAWFNVGTNHTALGHYLEAAAAYDQARRLGLPFRMLWYQFGPFEAYLAVGRYQDVIDLATANLEMVGNQEESWYYLGRARQALGNLDAARQCYAQALEYHPGFPPVLEALADLGLGATQGTGN